MLIDMNELPELLRAYIGTLRGVVLSALDDFNTKHRELRVDYTARTEASIIHDYMVKYAKGAGFDWKIKRNLFLFFVGNDFDIKPKKLDANLHTRRIPTQLALQFERQRVLKLFDNLDLTHLYLGYQRSGAELVTSSVWLVCPEGRRVKWAAELRAGEAAAVVEIALPPTMPTESEGRRVKAKPDAMPKREVIGE